MKSYSFVFSLIFLLSQSSAKAEVFQRLYEGFKKSDQIEEVSFEKELKLNILDIEFNQFDWKLDLTGNYLDSNLQSLFSFQSQQTISTTYQIGLSKSSYKYGTFSISHAQTSYDLSKWSDSSSTLSSFDSDKVYESKNSLQYTYEILNEFRKVEEREIQTKRILEEVSQDINIDQSHYDFFVTYLNAKVRILQDQLTRDSKRRAQQRVKLLRRRVKDGLSRTVDLNSARLAVLNQDENLLKNEALLREKLAILEDIMKMPFPASEYEKVKWSFKRQDKFPYLFTNSLYPELERMEVLNKISALNLIKLDAKQSHSLVLDLGYSINAVNTDRSESISDAMGSGNNDEKSITLKYSIPIGFETSSLTKTQKELESKRNRLRLKNTRSEFSVLSNVLSENIKRYSKAVTILDKKIALSNTIMKENQSLYRKGKVSFEEALRSEENLILTKLERINMYALYEGAMGRKAFLEGKIQMFLMEYRD